MTTVPYARLRVSKNGGAPLTGGVTAAHGDAIQLSAEHTATVKAWLWQIYEYPEGFTCPAGWSTDGSGIYYYNFGATPPAFALPASTTLWGKYFFRLTVDGGVGADGRPNTDLIDDRTAVDIPSPNGTEDMGFLESNQFDQQREVFGPLKRNLRLIDDMLDGVITGGSGSVAPLSLELHVDSDTAVDPGDQDGSIGAPFATVQAAIDAAAAGTTIRIIKFANGAHNLTIAKDITLAAARDEGKRPFGGGDRIGTTIQVGTLTITGARLVGISGITTGAIGCSAGTSTLTIADGADVGAITGGPVVRASFADLSGTIACSGESRFYSSRFLVNGTIISTSGTVLEVQGCRFTAGGNTIVFSGSAGTLYVDPIAHEYWLGVTETLTNGSLVVVGASLPTIDATLNYDGTTLRRAALTGDVTAALASNATAFRDFSACSILGRSTNSSGAPADIAAGTNDRLFCRVSDALTFSQLTAGMVPNDLVTDAMMRNSTALSVFGRASNSSGDPGDIVAGADDRILRRVGSALDFGQLTSGMVPSNTIPLAGLVNITTDRLLGRDTAGSGAAEELTVGGGLEFTGAGGIQRSALTGDVTAPAGSNATTIASGAIDLVHLSTEVTDAIAAAGGAPTSAEYLVGANHGDLSAQRLVSDTTTIAWDLATGGVARANVPDGSLSRAKLANAAGISILGRSADSAGALSDIPAPTNDRIFARVSNVLGFFQVTGPMIQSGEVGTAHYAANSVTNAILANMAEARLKGRAAGAGSGAATDLTGAQVAAILGTWASPLDLANNVALRGETTTPATFENLIKLDTNNAVVLGDGWVTGFAAAPGTLPTIGVLRFPNNSTLLAAATAAGANDTVLSYGVIGTNFTYLNGAGGLRLQGVGGVAQLGDNAFQFLSLTSPFVVSTNDRSDTGAAPLTIRAGGSTGSNNPGKALKLQGGRRAGTGDMGPVSIELNQDGSTAFPMVEAAHLANLRRVLSLVRGAALTTTQMPTDTGDLVAYIGNCATAPSASPVGGGILYVEAGELKFRATTGSAVTLGPNVKIPAAQRLELTAGTPSVGGSDNGLIEFKREGGGTSSFIGIRSTGRLRYEGQDGVDILGISSTAHVSIGSGSSASLGLQGGSGGVSVSSLGGKVTVQNLCCLYFDEVADQGNSGTAKTIEWSVLGATPSALQKVTLNNNVTFTFTDPEMPAYPLMLEIHQNGTGGFDCTFPTNVKDRATLSSTLLQTASTFAQVVFLWNGSFYTWQIVANGLAP